MKGKITCSQCYKLPHVFLLNEGKRKIGREEEKRKSKKDEFIMHRFGIGCLSILQGIIIRDNDIKITIVLQSVSIQ